jgi:anti-sigma factor RsiW
VRHLTLPQISASLDGELAGPSLELVQRHLAECELCRSDLARMAELDTLLVSAATYEPGEAFFDDLAARIEEGIGGRKRTPSRGRPESVPRRELPPVRLYPPAEAFGPGARIGGPEAASPRDAVPVRDVRQAPSSAPLEIERGEVVSAMESAMGSGDDARAGEHAPPAFDERAFADPEPAPAMGSAPLGDIAREAEFVDDVLEPERRYESTPRSRRREAHERRMAEERRRARRLKPRSGALIVLGIAVSALAFVIVMTMKNGPMLSGVVRRVMSPAESSSAPTPVDPPPDPTTTVEPAPDLATEMESAAEPPPAPEPAPPVARSENPAPRTTGAAETAAPPRVPRPKPVPPVEAAPVAVVPRASNPPPGPVSPRETAPQTSSAPHETPHGVAENPPPPRPPAITMPPVTSTSTTVTSPSVAVAGGTGAVGLLCGDVRDKDGRPIARAQVRLDIGVAVLTDRAGHFCMTAPRGGRGVTVTAAGFAPGKTSVTVSESTPQLAVTLEPLAAATSP